MCARFIITIDEKELREICNEAQRNTHSQSEKMSLKTDGEVFPTDIVPVQTGVNQYRPMKWGFLDERSRSHINARSETADIKPTFKGAMLEHRCLIPASGYYEWQKKDNKKIKYQFSIPGSTMFLAGCYQQMPDGTESRFVILTRPASKEFEFIHDRMPVIIPREHIESWFSEGRKAIKHAVTDLEYEAVDPLPYQTSLF